MKIALEQTAKEIEELKGKGLLDALQGHRIVMLDGDIDGKSANEISNRLLHLQMEATKPIHLLINCRGGETLCAVWLHDLIHHGLTVPVHALVMGRCSSAAVRILLACKMRRSMPHGRFVVHSGSMNNITLKQDGMTEKTVARLSEEIRKDTEELIRFYQDKLKRSRKVIQRLIESGDEKFDNSLSAEEALEMGLITEIVTGNAGIFAPVPERGSDE